AAFGDPKFSENAERKDPKPGSRSLMASNMGQDERWRSALRDIDLNRDTFDPSVVQELFYAKRELDNLRDVAGKDALVVSQYDATRERFLSADLTQYAMLHFATHGYLNPRRPENSGFVLSTVDRNGNNLDGFIGLREIYELRAPVTLVVLSACQTALGKDVRGEGLVGLTRGFMYAGASSVVASLWKVDDEATAELMKVFYSNLLRRGMTPAAALQAAQNSIRSEPRWRAPHFWAGFTLQGEYREPIKTRLATTSSLAWSWIVISVIGALMVVIGLAWWYRQRRLRMGSNKI
ncbi:MAG TPA: CHAT domain-containing protein, partial [Pyrinomonadaceae bacterium]|nr:CHAT domain-containing protein [Pyrinomonadaceae bacterium]